MLSANKSKLTPQNQVNNILNELFNLHSLARALPHTEELEEDNIVQSNQGESSELMKKTLRESINTGFNKKKVSEEHKEHLNWIDKQLNKQQNINHMLIDCIDQLMKGIQTLLHHSELSEQSHCLFSHHSTSLCSVSSLTHINLIWELMKKLSENRVYQCQKLKLIGQFELHYD